MSSARSSKVATIATFAAGVAAGVLGSLLPDMIRPVSAQQGSAAPRYQVSAFGSAMSHGAYIVDTATGKVVLTRWGRTMEIVGHVRDAKPIRHYDKTGRRYDKTGRRYDKTGRPYDKTGRRYDKTGR